MEREFAATPDVLFRAHTDPDVLKVWYGPNGFTVTVNDRGFDTQKGASGGTRFRGHRARHRGQHDGAGLCLPPGIHDGAAPLTDHVAIPHPRFGIDRLADGPQQSQAA